MAINWTDEQKRVINSRNKNLLVSAAAGSGKTAVLTERIISLITDEKDHTDLDRLLVVTFTKAAAGEMKERIRKKLEERIKNDRDNELLRRQSVLIHNAHISTIDSFCTYVIKNYFYMLDIDPNFRIMEDGERRLMKDECMSELFDDAFARGDEDILSLVTSYNTGKTTKNIRQRLLEIFETINAEPWPLEWLENAKKKYIFEDGEDINDSEMIVSCLSQIRASVKQALEQAKENLDIALSEGGCKRYAPMLEDDIRIIKMLDEATGFDKMREAFSNLKFKALSKAKPGADEDKKKTDFVKERRDRIKKSLTFIQNRYFTMPIDEIFKEMKFCSKSVTAICNVIEEFSGRFAEKKRSNNLMDFGDLEHFALDILVKKENGKIIRTDAAKEIAGHFDHVMTDEYQDSNEIQELILQSVSGEEDGIYNRFMVGDIKQSIYGFRHACPELFMDKYDSYGVKEDSCEVVDLHVNYRSRSNVVDTVNLFFENLMNEETGGVIYDKRQRLNCGAYYKLDETSGDHSTELLIIDKKDPGFKNAVNKADMLEAEAYMIAQRIKELRKTMKVFDPDSGEYRALRYSDCAILVRSTTDYFEIFPKVLQMASVPAHATSRTGYFSAFEVQMVLNYLRIIDNPLQDVALSSVLLSPIVGFTAEDIARIRILKKEGRLYDALEEYALNGNDNALRKKINEFTASLKSYCDRARFESVYELLNDIYSDSGLLAYASAMPAGVQRAANLKLLLQKAAVYEKTSYSGVFNFIRYIDEMQKASEDFGEANVFSDNSDSVKIMTIHKSKGLEFPVVFISGMNHKFNTMNLNKSIIIHKDLGIGIDAVDYENGKKTKGFYKKLIYDEMKNDLLKEELRILYVAMTRAKEKLIFTMISDDLDEDIKKASGDKNAWQKVSYPVFSSGTCYMHWILPVLASYSCFKLSSDHVGIAGSMQKECDFINIRPTAAGVIIRKEAEKQNRTKVNISYIAPTDNARIYDEKTYEILKAISEFDYAYKNESNIPEKITVSLLKSMNMENEPEEAGVELYKEEELFPYIPKFIQKDEKHMTGAARGTAYHKIFRYLDYSRLNEENDILTINKMIDGLRDDGFITKEERNAVYDGDIAAFVGSDIGKRMKAADARGELYREQPFTMQIEACEASREWSSKEPVLIQGVIDAFFIEDNEYVLVDYKTDHVEKNNENELKDMYSLQLKLYAEALEKSTGKKVRESMIYSTMLRKCVKIN